MNTIQFKSLAHDHTDMPTTVPSMSMLTFEDYAAIVLARVVETPVCPPSGNGSDHETVRVSA